MRGGSAYRSCGSPLSYKVAAPPLLLDKKNKSNLLDAAVRLPGLPNSAANPSPQGETPGTNLAQDLAQPGRSGPMRTPHCCAAVLLLLAVASPFSGFAMSVRV